MCRCDSSWGWGGSVWCVIVWTAELCWAQAAASHPRTDRDGQYQISHSRDLTLQSPSCPDMVRWTREECLLDVVCEEREEISSSSAGPCGGQTVGDTETALTVQSVLGRQRGHSQAAVTQWHHHNSPVRTWWGSHRSHGTLSVSVSRQECTVHSSSQREIR